MLSQLCKLYSVGWGDYGIFLNSLCHRISHAPHFLRSKKPKKMFTYIYWSNTAYRLSICKNRAVPWLRSLVAGLSPRRPGLIHVGFVVDKVALGQVFLRVLRFSPVISFHPRSPNSYHLGNSYYANVSKHPRLGLDPPHLQGGKNIQEYVFLILMQCSSLISSTITCFVSTTCSPCSHITRGMNNSW
jgi:hypothetical protein